MSVKKSELEAINHRLHEAVRTLSDENRVLQLENERLHRALSASDRRLWRLTRRYAKLIDYVRRLRAWANAQSGAGE